MSWFSGEPILAPASHALVCLGSDGKIIPKFIKRLKQHVSSHLKSFHLYNERLD